MLVNGVLRATSDSYYPRSAPLNNRLPNANKMRLFIFLWAPLSAKYMYAKTGTNPKRSNAIMKADKKCEDGYVLK